MSFLNSVFVYNSFAKLSHRTQRASTAVCADGTTLSNSASSRDTGPDFCLFFV